MLTRIGIRTKVDATTASQFFSRRNALDYPAFLAGWGAASGEMSSPLKSLVATYNPDAGLGVTNAGRLGELRRPGWGRGHRSDGHNKSRGRK